MQKIDNLILEKEVSWDESILGKATNMIFGSIKKGWQKTNLRFIANDWAAEYYKAIKAVKDEPETADTTDVNDEETSDVKADYELLKTKIITIESISGFLIRISDVVDLMIDGKKNGGLGRNKTFVVNFFGEFVNLKNIITKADINKDFISNTEYIECLKKIGEMVSHRNNIDDYISTIDLKDLLNISALLTKINDDLGEKILDLIENLNDLEESANAEKDKENDIAEDDTKPDEEKKKAEEQIKRYEDTIIQIKNDLIKINNINNSLKKELADLKATNNTGNSTTHTGPVSVDANGNVTHGINIPERLSFILDRDSVITERFSLQDMLTKYKMSLKDIKLNDSEKEIATKKVNLKKLALLQARAEEIYISNGKIIPEYENLWKKLLLMIENKFQDYIDVDYITNNVKKSIISAADKENIKDESIILKHADKAGISEAIKLDSVKPKQLIVIGFKRNNGAGYLLLQRLKEKNWYILHSVRTPTLENSEVFGKMVQAKFRSSGAMIVNFNIYKMPSAYMFMYYIQNGKIYNNKKGFTFDELKVKLDDLSLNKTDFFSLSINELPEDVNRRTISSVLLVGKIDEATAQSVYGVDPVRISTYNKTNKAVEIAMSNHDSLMNYANALPEETN